ncbi:hypothetical protein AYO21_02156 [Fonsecaea monophora]|uniref:Cutinase n=1 Tax=Fonsecaea monophora TaxID=254056 RepID=A0A177FIU9_9EURO|nr:hypothetical protein AYO21_02156 [Fonsecaea monophora]KAH0844089.1 hypothetical protein FOPE_08856 [Fonsecaea pedrosoi]OAG43570.1 hypothetical protein AYO21_02156 [Fonsecaea monophora]
MIVRLSWLAAIIIVVIILHATPGLAQDEVATSEVTPPEATSIEIPPPEATPVEVPPEPIPNPDEITDPVVPEEEGSEIEGTGEEQHEDEDVIPYTTPHLPEDCSDIRIFSARGSNEPYPGRGGEMLGVMCSKFEPQGVSCDYEDIVYPANISYSGFYCESANAGAYAGQAQLRAYAERCPDSKLVLLGYSQGAAVVGDMLGGGGGPIFGCDQAWNPSLPRDTAPGSKIAAVVAMGDPRFTADQPYNIGRGSTYNGTAPRSGQQLDDLNVYEDITAMWCNAGDPVCAVGSDPVNITAHWSYYDQYSVVASEWVVATVLHHPDVRLDLDLDGRNESVVLTGSNSSDDDDDSGGGGDENKATSLTGLAGGGITGRLGVAVLVTAGLIWTI